MLHTSSMSAELVYQSMKNLDMHLYLVTLHANFASQDSRTTLSRHMPYKPYYVGATNTSN